MGCTGFVNDLGDLSELQVRNTQFVIISRAPLEKLLAYKTRMGWERPWYSAFDTDFNQDFQVTVDGGERHGLSVFFRLDDDIFHTYSTYKHIKPFLLRFTHREGLAGQGAIQDHGLE